MNVQKKLGRLRSNKSLMNGALFSVFSFVNRGFAFFLLLILANYIVPTEYGYLSLFSTVTMVIMYIMAMSTEGYMSISYFKETKDQLKETYTCILLTSLGMGGVLLCACSIGGQRLATWLNLPFQMLYVAIAICFFTVFTNINLDYFRLQEKIKAYGFMSCGNALLNFILSIIFVKYFLLGWEGRVWAQFICYFLFGSFGLFYFSKRKLLKRPTLAHWKMMLLWGIPLIPHLATNFIRQGCDRYIINNSHTIEDVGLFSFALNLANIITMIGFGFNQSNSVDIFKTLGNQELTNTEKANKVAKQRHIFIVLYIIATLAVFLSCYFLVPILLPKYANAMQYFPLFSIYGLTICLYLVYTNFLFFYKKTKNLMYITFGSSVLHLCLSLLLTKYSLYYTAVLYIMTQSVVVLLVRHQAKQLIKKNLYVD